MTSSNYVQYGCGLCAPHTWINFDASPIVRVRDVPLVGRIVQASPVGTPFPSNVQYGDIVKGLPIPAGSCEGVYCSHTLEHLSLDDLRTALRNTRQVLKPGGTFRLVLPDLEQLAREYVDSDKEDAAEQFMRDAYLGKASRPKGLSGLLRTSIGNSAHLWMWDYKSLSKELKVAGFESIRRANYGDHSDPRFSDVEQEGRWIGQLGIECKRPAR